VRTIEHWIGGKPTPGSSHRYGTVWNPATGARQAQVPLGTASEVDDAVRAARTTVLFAFRELVSSRIGDLAEIVSDEHGKVVSDARGEVRRGLGVVDIFPAAGAGYHFPTST
jgi:malonate-semialdehyde dehydrogenase (acetylating)/methylmalonate-semialdehyde dehydrogenase